MASLASVTTWDIEADIVIVGYGLAGASAAIEALAVNPSAKVVIIEKMPQGQDGGNTRVSGQTFVIPKSAKALAELQRRMSVSNPIPEDVLVPWSESMMALEPWIKERAAEVGAEYRIGAGTSGLDAVLEYEEYGAAEAIAYNSTILPTPSGVWLAFKANIEKRPVHVEYETPVSDLIQDPDTLEMFGVVAMKQGKRINVKARKGVILACGGFENNLDMQRNYFGLSDAVALGSPANTGDGIKMLQKAGADMWHLRNKGQSGGIWPGFRVPGLPTAFLRSFYWLNFNWIEIAADSKRLYNETELYQRTHYKQKVHGHWIDTPHANAGPIHMIFDENVRANNCLVLKWMTWATLVNEYKWSADNSAEVSRGWIVKADTLEDLAALIKRDAEDLQVTIQDYNEACEKGVDGAFGRSAATLQPISTAPYYAIAVAPAIVCTGGGAKRNANSQVLDHAGTAIPRLYEAGELGSMFSDLYQNGSYLTEAMISGRAAGKHAALMNDWTMADLKCA